MRHREFSDLFLRSKMRGVQENKTAGRDEENEKRSLEAPAGLACPTPRVKRRDGRRQGLRREDSGRGGKRQERKPCGGKGVGWKCSGPVYDRPGHCLSSTGQGRKPVAIMVLMGAGIGKGGSRNWWIGQSIAPRL